MKWTNTAHDARIPFRSVISYEPKAVIELKASSQGFMYPSKATINVGELAVAEAAASRLSLVSFSLFAASRRQFVQQLHVTTRKQADLLVAAYRLIPKRMAIGEVRELEPYSVLLCVWNTPCLLRAWQPFMPPTVWPVCGSRKA